MSRDDILRHYDVTGKECPYYFVKHPDAWEGLLNSLTYNSDIKSVHSIGYKFNPNIELL